MNTIPHRWNFLIYSEFNYMFRTVVLLMGSQLRYNIIMTIFPSRRSAPDPHTYRTMIVDGLCRENDLLRETR